MMAADVLSSSPPQPKSVLIQPPRGVSFGMRELYEYRELLYFLVWRDLKVRYKQTVLGALWAIGQPLLATVIFSLFFGRLAGLPSEGVPYSVFVFAALGPWTSFANAVTQASNSLVASAHLITKVYFPRMIVPAAAVLASFVDLIPALFVLFALMVVHGVAPTASLLWLPVFVFVSAASAFGVSLWLATLNVRLRDVRHVLPFLVQLWMFATPVTYSSGLVPEPWRALYGLNPMVGVVDGFRWALLGTRPPSGPGLAASFGMTAVVLITGLVFFKRSEQDFADVI
jgi:lipopolysaccharide transport system permease protein